MSVTFDNLLKFGEHIENAVSKANRIIGILRRTLTFLDNDTFLQLYKTFSRPHVGYGNTIYDIHI